MATISETILWLEGLPEEIGSMGETFVKSSIRNHGHIVTGRMYNSVHHESGKTYARIWVWTRYASFVNDGRGPVYPKTKKALYWVLPTPLPHPVMSAGPYPGSHFFEEAYQALDSYCGGL